MKDDVKRLWLEKSEKFLNAWDKSIQHWKENLLLAEKGKIIDGSSLSCALCVLSNSIDAVSPGCKNCPLAEFGERCINDDDSDTAYRKASIHGTVSNCRDMIGVLTRGKQRFIMWLKEEK